jgi:hypothetical protein
MTISFKKIWNDYGIGAIIAVLLVAYGVNLLANYITNKGNHGYELMSSTPNQAYSNSRKSNSKNSGSGGYGPKPSEPLGQNEVFSSVNGSSNTNQISSCSKPQTQNPSDLLPKDNNSQWAQLNPSGKGELANINLLKAGYNIGIDTIGQSLRNANQQLRSDPPCPQLYVGPFNNSTIGPDFMRVPFEIGVGSQ